MINDKITAKDIELAVAKYFGWRQNIIIPNVSRGWAIHECDLLIIRPSGYCIEVEIKISIADFKKDLEKKHGHRDVRVKELYFAIPENLLEKAREYIPERAGIITIARHNRDSYTLKTSNLCSAHFERNASRNKYAPQLSIADKLKIAELGCRRIWDLKEKIIKQEKLIERER